MNEREKDAQDGCVGIGVPVPSVARSLDRNKHFWMRGSVVAVAREDPGLAFTPLSQARLMEESSYSSGGDYYLGWRDKEVDTDIGAVLKIERRLLSSILQP